MSIWTAIAVDTPINDSAVIGEILEALRERASAVFSSQFDVYALWPKVDPDEAVTATGVYGIDQESESPGFGDGGREYSAMIAVPPIVPGTLTLTAGDQTLVDDGEGGLSDGQDGTGRVDYATGCLRFTFAEPVETDTEILADYTSDRTTLTMDGLPYLFRPVMVGHKIWLAGEEGETHRILAVASAAEIIVAGDLSCEASSFGISPAGTPLDAAWWSAVQTAVKALPLHYVDSFNYPDGFEGETAVTMFTWNSWWDAAGLFVFPRAVPSAGPASGVYDSESDSTTLTDDDLEAEGWFKAGQVGARISIVGVGTFSITAVADVHHATVEGNAACEGRKYSVLPQDWQDQEDPAFCYRNTEAGDVLGPWLLADLQAALKALRWTKALSLGWTNDGEDSGAEVQEGGVTYAAAKAAAAATYAATLYPLTGPPRAWTRTFVAGYQQYFSVIERAGNKMEWAVDPSATCSYDIDLYALPRQYPGGGWNGNGDFGVENRLKLWATETDVEALTGTSAAYCGRRPPALPAWPSSDPGLTGYLCDDSPPAVARWHFAFPAT